MIKDHQAIILERGTRKTTIKPKVPKKKMKTKGGGMGEYIGSEESLDESSEDDFGNDEEDKPTQGLSLRQRTERNK